MARVRGLRGEREALEAERPRAGGPAVRRREAGHGPPRDLRPDVLRGFLGGSFLYHSFLYQTFLYDTTADRQNFGKMLLVFGCIGTDLCK